MPKIIYAKNIGKHQTFDVELAHPDHQFFLSNGLLTSNSHSDAYSVMTMQCAYLATYYPMEWYAAVLTKGQSGELQQYVGDIKRAGIKLLPVDVNSSKANHVIEGDIIRLALSSVIGVGPAAIEKIVSNQPYTDFIDFVIRSGVSKTAISPLIKAGAFDCLHSNMKELEVKFTFLDDNKEYKKKTRGKKEGSHCWEDYVRYFNTPLGIPDYQLHEKVAFENELFGFSLRGSPFEILDRDKKIDAVVGADNIFEGHDHFVESDWEVGVIPVVVKRIFEKPQRNGQMMAFLTFEDKNNVPFDAPCFSTIWKWIKPITKVSSVYLATFNRKLGDEDGGFVVGKPGFAHSMNSAQGYMIDLDSVET